ncbi:Bug family tripartite tricarboxylate transporter substrate binding protein [Lacisediminimonas profundi]|uniref:Bug family tripartite tricarboxylate transporter substrate binding protein n=1 Tax=Lacisediminimonas profundi TaxID=2603856 RepID=UPI00124B5B8C|nr:tripartite tricarboxylate transporter substrate binding protein [Lacisediminimonas profundi]
MDRRSFLLAGASAIVAAPAFAQSANDWPSRPIRIVVPFAAGGPTDFIARLLATPLSAALGQSVVIENRPGASGNIGSQAVADAAPDGYTLVHNTVGMHGIIPLMYPSLRLQPLRDLVPIATTGAMANVLVTHPSKLQVGSVRELVEKGRSRPGALTFATFGNGTSPHVYAMLLQKLGGFTGLAIPYRGSAPAMTAALAGEVDFLFDNISTCAGQIKAGTLKGLGITSTVRSSLLPNLPTMKEAGFPGFDLNFWFSLEAPAKTPAPIVEKLQMAMAKVLADKSYIEGLQARGAEPFATKPSELISFVASETERWQKTATNIGIKAD